MGPRIASLCARILATALVGLWEPGSVRAQPVPRTLRVMTYNIHHGTGVDGVLDVVRIAALIQRDKADIVALQEVDRGVERTSRRDLIAELAKLTGMTPVFHANLKLEGGEYGNAVLSRFPVRRHRNTRYRASTKGEQRGLLQVVLDVDGRDVLVLNTHLDHHADPSDRLANVAELKEVAASYGSMPAILAGDFNDTPGSGVHAAVKAVFADAWEAVGEGAGLTEDVRRIDYVFTSKGSSLEPLRAEVSPSPASDHLRLTVAIRLR